jgi:hypothetical protein
MTLVFTHVRPHEAVLTSDRRLTAGSDVVDDSALKGVLLNCRDATVAIGYTQTAYLGADEDLRTDLWIAHALTNMKAGELPLADLLPALTDRVGEVLAETPGEWRKKPLTIVGVGVGVPAYRWWVISNERDDACVECEAGPIAKLFVWPSQGNSVTSSWGASLPDVLAERLIAQVDGGVFDTLSLPKVAWEFVRAIRAADTQLVGHDCISICIPKEGLPWSIDHSTDLGVTAGVHFIRREGSALAVTYETSPPSESTSIPVETWPDLRVDIRLAKGIAYIQNQSEEPWQQVRLDVNGAPPDYNAMAAGVVESTGYFRRSLFLGAGQTLKLGLQGLHRLPDFRSLPPRQQIDMAVLTAMLPSGRYGMLHLGRSGLGFERVPRS